jgi:hypothetical protein
MLAEQLVGVCEQLRRCQSHERGRLVVARRQAIEHLVDYVVEPDPDFDKEHALVNRAVRLAEERRQADEALARVGV